MVDIALDSKKSKSLVFNIPESKFSVRILLIKEIDHRDHLTRKMYKFISTKDFSQRVIQTFMHRNLYRFFNRIISFKANAIQGVFYRKPSLRATPVLRGSWARRRPQWGLRPNRRLSTCNDDVINPCARHLRSKVSGLITG